LDTFAAQNARRQWRCSFPQAAFGHFRDSQRLTVALPEASGLRLLGCGGFAVGQEPSRDVEVTLVHHEVPSGSDSPHAIQARSAGALYHNGWDRAYYDQTAQEETMMAFTAMLSELYDAFRRKIGADEPPAKTAAEAVVIEDARFRSIDGKFDALNQTMDQRFDVLNQPIDGLIRVMDQRFDALKQRLDALDRMIDERFATVDQRFAAMDQDFAARDAVLVRLETKTTKTATEMDALLARLETKTATEFRQLRWCLGIVILLVLGLVTKVILDWAMP
jgi:hypothetical protein